MSDIHQQDLEIDHLGLLNQEAKHYASGVSLILPKRMPVYDNDEENGGKMKGFYFPHPGNPVDAEWGKVDTAKMSKKELKARKDFIEEIKKYSNCEYSYSDVLQYLLKPSDYWTKKLYGWENINVSLLKEIMELSRKKSNSNIDPVDKVLDFIMKWGPLWKCVNHDLCFLSESMQGTQCGCKWKPFEPLQDYLDLSAFFIFFTRLIISIESEDDYYGFREHLPDIPTYKNLIDKIVDFTNLSEQKDEKKIFAMMTLFNHIKAHNAFELSLSVERFGSDDYYFKPEWDMGLGVGRAAWFLFFRQLLGQGKVAICDRCFQPYMRGERRPKAGQKNYCDNCRRGNKGGP